jgi:hypothetical protein
LSEREKILRRGFRHAHIGFAVAMALSIAAMVALSGIGKGVAEAGVWTSVIIGAAVYLTLDIRAERRDERDQ